MKVTSIKKTKLLHKGDYVNVTTGELLSSEQREVSVYTGEPVQLVEIKYKSFVIINNDAIVHISEGLGSAIAGHITKMTTSIQGYSNTLTKEDNKTPHDSESLRLLLSYSRNKYYEFINKLIRRDIVHEIRRVHNGRIIKTIVLNPSIARRSSKIDKALLEVFHDLSEGLPSLNIDEVNNKIEQHIKYLDNK